MTVLEVAVKLDEIRDFAFARDIAVVALHPIDFRRIVLAADAKVKHGRGPTPRSLCFDYFTIHTARGSVGVVCDRDAPPGRIQEAPFAGALPR